MCKALRSIPRTTKSKQNNENQIKKGKETMKKSPGYA
jgi:hypothetical protein